MLLAPNLFADTANTSYTISADTPHTLFVTPKTFHIQYKAVAEIGISIDGEAWESLEKKGDIWVYETYVGALGNSVKERLEFALGAGRQFLPRVYTVIDKSWTRKTIRIQRYDYPNRQIVMREEGFNNNDNISFARPINSFDPLSMRLITMDLLRNVPAIRELHYLLIDGKDIVKRRVKITQHTITTLLGSDLVVQKLLLDEAQDRRLEWMLSAAWHQLPVGVLYQDSPITISLRAKHIVYDGTDFMRVHE